VADDNNLDLRSRSEASPTPENAHPSSSPSRRERASDDAAASSNGAASADGATSPSRRERASDGPTSDGATSADGATSTSTSGREGGSGGDGEEVDPTRMDRGIMLDAKDDRWEWRRKIRADPKKHAVYRVVVGFVGVFLLLLAAATGWLPGPGGIPLALLGLAVLASEFEWAQRLLYRVKKWVHKFTSWTGKQPAWLKLLGSVALIVGVLVAIWGYLAVLGVPGWFPNPIENWLLTLPLL
jgi:hypothetical protein